jgi:hypothetical protein
MDKRNTFLEKKAQRRRGDRDDDERRRRAMQRTTPRTRDRGEPEYEAVPQLDPRACWRDGSEEGDDDECRRGAKRRWSEPNAGDEGPPLDPLGTDEGPSSGKEERADEGAAKWARGVPHICEHKCLATTKRCRGSGEEGVEDLISDSGNDYDEASFSESHCLFTCSIDVA